MESFSFIGRDKRHAQDLNGEAQVTKRISDAAAREVSVAIQALPDDARHISVDVNGNVVRVTSAVTSDGVRHTAKDDREHGFAPFSGTERRGSGKDNGLRRRSTD